MVQVMPNLTERDLRRRNNAFIIGSSRVVVPEVGDYVILWEEVGKSRKHLAQVEEVRSDSIRVTHEVGRQNDYSTVETEYPHFHLLANLGPSPTPGSAYGVKIEPWRGNRLTSSGIVSFWTRLDKRSRKVLAAALKKTRGVLIEQGLGGVYPIDWRIEANSGKWAGWYKNTGGRPAGDDGGTTLDTICLKPAEYDRRNTEYVVFHELGHGVFTRLLHPNEHARWVATYHDYLQVEGVDEESLATVRTGLLAAGADYRPDGDSPEGKVFEAVKEYMARVHRLDKADIYTLLMGGQTAIVEAAWPQAAELSEFSKLPSEYSEVSPQECFCEVFAFYLMGTLQDKRLENLMKKTLARARGRASNIGN